MTLLINKGIDESIDFLFVLFLPFNSSSKKCNKLYYLFMIIKKSDPNFETFGKQ